MHVHGWGGHAATGDAAALDGMARALLRRGVTSFLPTAPTLPEAELPAFADRVRALDAGRTGRRRRAARVQPRGPVSSPRSAAAPTTPGSSARPPTSRRPTLDAVLDGLRVITIAPELPGALELIGRLAAAGVAVSLGHSAATLDQARAGYRAGARSTTHLFNAMSGVDHRAPGLAVAALTEDGAFAELIADGFHVDPALWPIVARAKPADRLLLVSDALPIAGVGDGADDPRRARGRGRRAGARRWPAPARWPDR